MGRAQRPTDKSAEDALRALNTINDLPGRARKNPENVEARREQITKIMHGLAGRGIVFDPHKDHPEQRTHQVPDVARSPQEAQRLRRRLEVTIAKVALTEEPEVVSETRGMFVVWGELMTRVLKPDSPDEDYARRIVDEDDAIQIEGELTRYADGTAEIHGDLLSGASEVVFARVLVSDGDGVRAVRDPDTMRQDPVAI